MLITTITNAGETSCSQICRNAWAKQSGRLEDHSLRSGSQTQMKEADQINMSPIRARHAARNSRSIHRFHRFEICLSAIVVGWVNSNRIHLSCEAWQIFYLFWESEKMTVTMENELKKVKLREEISILHEQLKEKSEELRQLCSQSNKPQKKPEDELTREDVMRYSRQMMVPSISPSGQKKLKKSSVLIVGCGGLGCPAAQYLVGCGIGRIGLVDYDLVEENNLHRQLLHSEETIGVSKVKSLSQALNRINSSLQVDEYNALLNSANALDILPKYDVVIDASDNVATRYLVNDACVLARKPLVSGSAVGIEGQLTVYNHDEGPCYRCLFPTPPPPETVSNCSDVGVVGPVPGCIGVLQALQAVHILIGNGKALSRKLLLFDGVETKFRTIQLRGKSASCPVCGANPTLTQLIDYEQFCGSPANDKERKLQVVDETDRVSAASLKEAIDREAPFVLIDVRTPEEFEMCRLPKSINAPLKELTKNLPVFCTEIRNKLNELVDINQSSESPSIYVICRRGNDSQLGLKLIKEEMKCRAYDVTGGLHAWSKDVDPTFPPY